MAHVHYNRNAARTRQSARKAGFAIDAPGLGREQHGGMLIEQEQPDIM